MRAVDTNVLVRLMTRDDAGQAAAAEAFVAHGAWVPHVAVAAAVALFRQWPKVGFSDCLMVEVARKAGHTPLGTFDRGSGKIAGAQRLQVHGGTRTALQSP